MMAIPNWTRWIFASVAHELKTVATNVNLAVLIEGFDERSDVFMQASDRVEIRITGPFSQQLSKGVYRIWVDANVLISSRYDGASKNAGVFLKHAGLFHERMDGPIPVWNYGPELTDYKDADPDSKVFIGCLLPRPGKNESVKVFHFGQSDKTDKYKQSVVDARYEMYLYE